MRQVKAAYISIKPLVNEQAFPLTEFVGLSAHATFCGSGWIMSTAGLELPYLCISNFPRPSLGTSLLGKESNVTVHSHV